MSWEYPPVVEGGLARHVRGIAEGQAALGAEVHVVTRGAPGRERRAGVHVHRVAAPPVPRDLGRFLPWVAALDDALLRAAAQVGPVDVVHGHDWLVGGAVRALAAARDVPLLVTLHATEHLRHEGRVDASPQSDVHAAEAALAAAADHVVVCSQAMRAHVLDVFGLPSARVSVVPNGVDAPDLARPPARPPAEPPGVLAAGRLVHEKGLQDLLDALALLPAPPRLTVAGDGPHRAALEAQARALGLEGRVRFAGWCHDDELAGLLRAAELVVVPSRAEPFGLVALEALAAGRPLVVTDVGGLPEVVPPEVPRVPPADPPALAAALAALLADGPRRARLAALGPPHAARFTWAVAARRVAELGDALVGGRARV